MPALFVSAYDLHNHPLLKESHETRKSYLSALQLVLRPIGLSPSGKELLRQYYQHLLDDEKKPSIWPNESYALSTALQSLPVTKVPYLIFLLLYDAARFVDDISSLVKLNTVFASLALPVSPLIPLTTYLSLANNVLTNCLGPEAGTLYQEYLKNRSFCKAEEHKIVVTATVSAGKSTLINALTGKRLARVASEVCTGAICHIYNKLFEDGRIHLADGDSFNFDISEKELTQTSRTSSFSLASYFQFCTENTERLCLIDTPGVDPVGHDQHLDMTRDCLRAEQDETIVCVLEPTKLDTNATWVHIKWMGKNLRKENIVFVVNKIDNLNPEEDDREACLARLKNGLLQLGWTDPVICPVSAYFAFLLKRREKGFPLSEEELDDYDYFVRKFSKPQHNLTFHYEGQSSSQTDSEFIRLSKACGMYGLEQVLLNRTNGQRQQEACPAHCTQKGDFPQKPEKSTVPARGRKALLTGCRTRPAKDWRSRQKRTKKSPFPRSAS